MAPKPSSNSEGPDAGVSSRVLGIAAILIGVAIIVMLVAGGAYWWSTRSGRAFKTAPGQAVFTGTPVDRIQLASGALKDWNILLISVDTLRADYVGCYGKRRVQTPVFDGLARKGVLFRQAVSPVPITLASHASMLSGLNPPHHGVRSNGLFRFRAETGTLATMLKEQGYTTGGVIGAFVLDSKFGLNQGFDFYNDDMTGGRQSLRFTYPERRAEQVNDVAVEWLRRHAKSKFFLFVHYFDPHFPYAPPAPWSEHYATNPYAGEIAYVDQQVGRLLAAVDELGVRSRTLVILTSDHGESMGEHGERTHALLIYDATQLVPLIMSAPAPFPQNRIVNRQVGIIDIVPTVLSLLGISAPGKLDGMSLLEPPPAGPRPMYIETLYPRLAHNWAPLLGIRRDDLKFIYAPKPEVYDLLTDPAELNNLYDSKRGPAGELFARLREMIGGDPEVAADVRGNLPVDDKTRHMLQDLGYVVPGPTSDRTTTAIASLPDPKDMVAAYEKLMEAEELVAKSQWKQAETVIRSYLELSRQDAEGSHIAGQIYRQLGRYDESLKWFTRAASLGYEQAEALAGIGSVHVAKKDFAKAEEAYKKALQIDPRATAALLGMGTVYGEQGREADAMRMFQDALEHGQGLNAGMAWMGISNLHRKAGRIKEADEALNKAVELEPANPVIAKLAAAMSERGGNPDQAIDRLKKAADSHPTTENLFRLARLLSQQKRHAEAVTYLNQLVKRGDATADVHYELGLALMELKQVEPAAASFIRATELDSKHGGALGQLGMLFARAGRFEEAESYMTRAVAADPNSYQAHYNLGLVLANRQTYDRAVQELRRAIELNPDYAKAYTKLGLILAEQGKAADAIQQYRKALSLDPNDAEAAENLKTAGMK